MYLRREYTNTYLYTRRVEGTSERHEPEKQVGSDTRPILKFVDVLQKSIVGVARKWNAVPRRGSGFVNWINFSHETMPDPVIMASGVGSRLRFANSVSNVLPFPSLLLFFNASPLVARQLEQVETLRFTQAVKPRIVVVGVIAKVFGFN